MTGFRWLVVVWLMAVSGLSWGQGGDGRMYSRLNTWSVFGEYSNDSSRILLGNEINRKIGAVGFGYERRLVHARNFDLSYAAEWRPGMLESDPEAHLTLIAVTSTGTTVYTPLGALATDKCIVGTVPFPFPPGVPPPVGSTLSLETTCGRRQVIEQGLSPLGFRLGTRTRHRLQPTFSAKIGILMATQAVPSANDADFNVAFDVAAGLEMFQKGGRSLRIEYVVQHYGSLGTVPSYGTNPNPGVDNGFVKMTFAFGRVK